MSVLSPLTGSNHCVKISARPCEEIIEGYKSRFNIMVNSYFSKSLEIERYKCLDTGYVFFFPYSISGDSFFYEELSKFDWYYMSWKWENDKVFMQLKKDTKLLEIGSGKGEFLSKVSKELNIKVTGLELNVDAVHKAKAKGINVLNQSILEYQKMHKKQFDYVCAFQVLEHISGVKLFIQSMVNCLKENGKLFITVPNNESFFKNSKNDFLNMPPHHMGQWTKTSLYSIKDLYGMSSVSFYLEPLQHYHVYWYVEVFEERFFKQKYLNYAWRKFGIRFVFQWIVSIFRKYIKGHTILAVFQK